ncbi:MAG TPA: arginase [Chloroflexota bacterium]|nr:arginase [Chloroflexota bacterium]
MKTDANRIEVVGVPLDLGAGLRGVDVGPSAMRLAGLLPRLRALGYEVSDAGNLPAAVADSIAEGNPKARYAGPVAEVCQTLRASVTQTLKDGATPVILGGDHSIAAGTLAGLLDERPPLRVLWLDAHGDMNTPTTTPSGNVHGMPLAAALGEAPNVFPGLDWDRRALGADRIVLIGLRSLDPGERALIKRRDIRVYTMSDIDRYGIHNILERALDYLHPSARQLHLSLDLDVVDPDAAPGVGTPVSGGMTIREAHLAMEMIAQTGFLGSLEAVEVNAFRDTANKTGRLATDLILSAFGQTIL